MIQMMLQLIPWLVIGAIVVIPFLCVVLYRHRKLRTCILFSHLWCMAAFFLLGAFVLHTLRRYDERSTYADQARQLLETAKMLRAGDARKGIMSLDECLAATLYRTAYDIPDEKMRELDPDLLWVWQEVKEYYDTYEVNEPTFLSAIPRVYGMLDHVPWSDMQLAIRKFERMYRSGQRAVAPAINMKSWISRPLMNDDLKSKVILLDFWNTRCVPCIKSHPDLQKIHDAYMDRGLVVIACAGGNERVFGQTRI
jgi:thiol-disulfide isomerase/thioredoxin